MIDSWLFVVTMFVVLLIPGPSNAFLASFAHQHGITKSTKLIPLQLLGYYYAINLWSLLVHLTMPVWPYLIHLLHGVSVLYIGWLAIRLWRKSDLQKQSHLYTTWQPKQIFWSTLKNPKSILLAVGILPIETWASPQNWIIVFTVFSLVAIPIALFWMLLGQHLLNHQQSRTQSDLIYKGSAIVLVMCLLPILIQYFH